jgi:cytochrome oxidase assembly protein ShyY1
VLGAHAVGLVCVVAATWLGFWQLGAWQAHREAEQRDLTSAEPVPVEDVLGPDDPFPGRDVGRPVRISGTWLPEGTVLVEDRAAADGTEGSWVVTPLTVGAADAPAVPVVRGWLPADAARDAVPTLPEGTAEVVGWLQPGEGTGAADDDPDDDVLPQLRIADLVQRVDQDLYGAYVVLDTEATEAGPATEDLEPATLDQLPPAGRFTALRNLLYAIEWWLFAGFAAFLWWRHVRDVTRPGTGAEDADADAVASDA